MNSFTAFAAGAVCTVAFEFLVALFFQAWTKKEVAKAEAIIQKYGSQPWANAPGSPKTQENLQKIEDYIKLKFPSASTPVVTYTANTPVLVSQTDVPIPPASQ